MAKFNVTVKVIAEVEYTVEVEADREHEAEDIAISMDREMMPTDFQVNKGYVTNWDIENIERLTHVCERCEREYPAEIDNSNLMNGAAGPWPLMPWKEDCDYCEQCGIEIEAEEAEANAEPRVCAVCGKTLSNPNNEFCSPNCSFAFFSQGQKVREGVIN